MTGQYNECHGRLRISSTLVHHFSIFRTLTQRYMCSIYAAPSTRETQPRKEYIINNEVIKRSNNTYFWYMCRISSISSPFGMYTYLEYTFSAMPLLQVLIGTNDISKISSQQRSCPSILIALGN